MFEIIPNWHPVFVHFSVALLTLSVFVHQSVLVIPGGCFQTELEIFARWSLWFGTLFAIVTAVFGWFAYTTVAHDDIAHVAMATHRNLALLVVVLFILLALWSAWRFHRRHVPVRPLARAGFVTALTLAGALLASTAWRGGELVYRHGLGVMSFAR